MCKLESQKSVDDETTPQSEARRGSHVRPMDAASYRWVIGLLPAPELPEKVAAHLAEILPDLLRSEVDERNDWYVEIVCDPLTGGAGDPAEILDEAEKRKHQHGWDFAISITDLPILRQDHVVVADAVLEKGVGGISVPATGGMLMYRRSERAAVLVLRELVSKEPKHRIDDESRETGQTRLSWMAVSHVDESRASRSATPRRGWKSAVRQPRNLWTAWALLQKSVCERSFPFPR